jgi:hypothetical protein
MRLGCLCDNLSIFEHAINEILGCTRGYVMEVLQVLTDRFPPAS